MTHGQLTAVVVDDSIEAWRSIGFAGDDVVTIGRTTIVATAATQEQLDDHRRGIVGAAVEAVGELDGLELGSWTAVANTSAAEHPNGVTGIDHIVVMTPDCDRTTRAFEAHGLEARRVRRIELPDGDRRQTFFWLGDVVCEVVGPDAATGDGPARWWGLALTVRDLGATVEFLGDRTSQAKPAVQPGRQVSTLRRDAGLGVPILFISERGA